MKRLFALTLALLLLLCCGCTPEAADVSPEESPTPTPMPQVPVAVETVLDKPAKDVETVDVAVLLHGVCQKVDLSPSMALATS